MARLRGRIADATSGGPLEAKVHVLSSAGKFVAPPDAILKVGSGHPFFYANSEFEVELPVGQADVLVERGTEYLPLTRTLQVPTEGTVEVELPLSRWTNLPERGWHPGNTHIHYDENEKRPDERLRFDSSVEDYSVTVISVLTRRELPYASNKYPIGMFTDLTTSHHVVDVGEESRHNSEPWNIGYGHVMFINIRNIVEPVSRGTLAADLDPDYPPLCWACDDAREQGGTVIWCHNGQGMEAPVAAALGKLHAFNLFDPVWMDPEYRIYYHLLNAGIRLPASTGTDWFVCSSNRVYVNAPGEFSYGSWLEGLRRGKTFITNGPAIFLSVNDSDPGTVLQAGVGRFMVRCRVSWDSHYPVDAVELVVNGSVAARHACAEPDTQSWWDAELDISHDSWLAARLQGRVRNSFGHFVYAHTSPIYVQMGRPHPSRAASARFLVDGIDGSLKWIESRGRYATDAQRRDVADLFLQARGKYAALLEP